LCSSRNRFVKLITVHATKGTVRTVNDHERAPIGA
jgi:hypothetical protein